MKTKMRCRFLLHTWHCMKTQGSYSSHILPLHAPGLSLGKMCSKKSEKKVMKDIQVKEWNYSVTQSASNTPVNHQSAYLAVMSRLSLWQGLCPVVWLDVARCPNQCYIHGRKRKPDFPTAKAGMLTFFLPVFWLSRCVSVCPPLQVSLVLLP